LKKKITSILDIHFNLQKNSSTKDELCMYKYNCRAPFIDWHP